MTYGHGDDKYRYGDRIKMNFSSNIYQRADLTELKDYLATRLDAIGNYPEPEPRALEALIAEKLEISADMVMVTNGANEAIYLIAQLYRHWASVIPQPTYNEYADACRMFGHTISYDRNDELNILPEDRIYWLCNPDNPTGNVLLKSLITHIIRKHPRYLYVIDQSYADYTLQPMLEMKEMLDCYNVMILQSLSKKYCVPGLRLGYLTASPIIIDRLRDIRQPGRQHREREVDIVPISVQGKTASSQVHLHTLRLVKVLHIAQADHRKVAVPEGAAFSLSGSIEIVLK